MSRRNHQLVDGRLLQMDKRFVALKQAQKEKINCWLYDAYRECCLRIGKEPGRERNANIIGAAYQKIEAAEIWIPYGEIVRYYSGRKTAFWRRFLREIDADGKHGDCSQAD